MTIETVEQILALLTAHPVSEIVLERDGERLRVRKPLLASPRAALILEEDAADAAAEPLREEAAEAAPTSVVLTATMVGLFHHAMPQVNYGALVTLGQAVGSIESMKVMNDIPASTAGRVVDVFVEEGAPVEYGQALFRLALP